MKRTDKRKYRGVTQTLEEWAEQYNLRWLTLYHRLMTGYTFKEALETPFRPKRGKVVVDGEPVNLRRMALQADLPYLCVWKRVVKLGWDLDTALSTPVDKGNKYKSLRPEEDDLH